MGPELREVVTAGRNAGPELRNFPASYKLHTASTMPQRCATLAFVAQSNREEYFHVIGSGQTS
jgi:hypothetical protein